VFCEELFHFANESPNRKYQRTARTIISAANLNPANDDTTTGT
jgi:hypothetical protein